MRRIPHTLCIVLAAVLLTLSTAAIAGPVTSVSSLATDKVQEDFPAMCLDATGTPWVAYVEWTGKADTLKIARKIGGSLKCVGKLAGPSVIHQPAIACDGKGTIWVIWSQVNAENVMDLHARSIVGGKIQPKTISLAGAPGNVFADAGTDAAGRVWVAWQSFRNGHADIYTRCYDPSAGDWGKEIQVTSNKEGDWEPQLAFGEKDTATIVFDSSRNGNFDVYLATVTLAGKVTLKQVTKTDFYEARASIAASPNGKGYWLAWEKGKQGWGKDTRGHGAGPGALGKGLNMEKFIEVAYVDAATGSVTRTPAVRPLLVPLVAAGAGKPAANQPAKKAGAKKQPAKKQPAKKPRRAKPKGLQAVNVPEIAVDSGGNPWLAARYCNGVFWKIALVKYDAKQKAWTNPTVLPDSSFGQDRHCTTARDAKGNLWLAWPSDQRTTKRALSSGVYVAQVDPAAALAVVPVPAGSAVATAPAPVRYDPLAYYGGDTPERTRADRHVWEVGGKKYYLYFGDFHRHTDVSNCATPRDGCILEQFRYAYDMGKLDFLGTSDHTDVGKPYDPYEWWCNQKLADVFHAPEFFNSFYVYEREQKWPWGHRNVIFIERGGTIVYIKRALYKSMPWNKVLPVGAGGIDITPMELWKILRKNGMDVTIISHTGATGMGTDWDKYGQIDHAVENLVEVYQGCRVSYEGIGTPQPTVGLPKATATAPGKGRDFNQYNKGVYRNALRNGYKLGAFASSDHISTNATFGAVFVESFTRKGILDALNARRTFGATDKTFVHYTCNGHLMGEIFTTTDKPTIKIGVRGTAPLHAVTVIRNEMDVQRFAPKGKKDLDVEFTDSDPVVGENRYYVRVEQTDGNMAWTSPVWVTYKR